MGFEHSSLTSRNSETARWHAEVVLFFLGLFLMTAYAQTPQELVRDAIHKQQMGNLDGAVEDYKKL